MSHPLIAARKSSGQGRDATALRSTQTRVRSNFTRGSLSGPARTIPSSSERSPSRIGRRRAIRQRYHEALAHLPGVDFLPVAAYGEPNYWLTCVTIDPGRSGTDRESVRLALEGHDIESRPTWKPLHLQPVFADHEVVGGAVCARIFEHGLCLPSGSALSVADQSRVVDVVRELVTGR